MKGELGNIVGPQIRKRRYGLGWSQAKLAVKLQIIGFDISRESLAKVEIQIHKVEDYQLPFYARALNVQVTELFPPLPVDKPIHDTIETLRTKRNGAALKNVTLAVNGNGNGNGASRNGSTPQNHGQANGISRSVEQKEQMTLPLVQVRTEPK